MSQVHLKTGISDAEWFQRSLAEAKLDPVGLWQMVKAGREGFGLSGAGLTDFVSRFIEVMIAGGGCPVVGDKSASFGWRRTDSYGVGPCEIAKSLVDEWLGAGVDPDVDGVWFAFPMAFE